MDSADRRRSSSLLDTEKLAKLQQLRVFSQTGGFASKLIKGKAQAGNDDSMSAAAALSLSKVMARKKGVEPLSLQIEIETETQWKLLLRREGLIVVEAYAGWCGPCISMVNILKKVKVDANDDRLILATANSDNIPDLKVFKGQSEPAWIFIGGGKPVKLMRGASSAKVVAAIKSEFEHELLCMEGKAKRTLISLRDEAERKRQAESEAIKLAVDSVKKVESIHASASQSRDKTVTPEPQPVTEETEKVEDASPGDGEDVDAEEEEPKSEAKSEPESLDEESKLKEEINMRLMTSLESYTVIAIQGFLLETGAVTEIKDHLRSEFKIIQERYIILDEAGVRELFAIPYDIDELIDEAEEELVETDETSEIQGEGQSQSLLAEGESLPTDGTPRPNSALPPEKAGGGGGGESGTEENEAEDGVEQEEEEKVIIPRYKKVPVPLPEELVGDTLLFLLESLVVKSEKEKDPEVILVRVADNHIQEKVGPENFQEAKDNEPKSLHALYGREEHSVGVWCPRKYDDKKYVMLNYFPQFVTEMLMPPPKEVPKYKLAIFPALFSYEIMDHPELLNNAKDVIAKGKLSIPPKLVDRILRSRGFTGEDLEAQKRALLGYEMFAVSVDERNETLLTAVLSMEPIHISLDNDNGCYETAKLFPHLNLLIDNDYDDEPYRRDLIVEKFLTRTPKLRLEAILDSESTISNNDEIPTPPKSPKTVDENSHNHSYASQETIQE